MQKKIHWRKLITIACIGVITLIMLSGCGVKEVESITEKEIEQEKATNVRTATIDFDDLSTMADAIRDAETPYLWIKYGKDEQTILEMEEEQFNDKLDSTEFTGDEQNWSYRYRSIEAISKCAEALVCGLTKEDGDIEKTNFYFTYNADEGIAALNNVIVETSHEDGTSYAFYQENGLELDVTNAETEKIAVWDWTDQDWSGAAAYYAVVKADVTCVENDGAFKEIDWIPEEGETKEVRFLLLFESATNDYTILLLHNFYVM